MDILVFEAVRELISREFGVPGEQVHADSTLESLGLDSLHAVAMLLELESSFGVQLGDLSISRTSSLRDLMELIRQRMDSRSSLIA
jgi:acyl carrier protein